MICKGFKTTSAPHSHHTLTRVVLTLAVAILFVVLARPLLSGRIYVEEDFSAFHLPVRHFYAECLKNGDDPSWMPLQYCGFYLHGEGQAGLYHPIHQILYRFLPFDIAFNLDFLWAYPFAFAGMYLFLRRAICLSDFAAGVGAVMFSFAGTMITNYMYIMMVAVLAHVPWALYCIDCIARGRSGARYRAPAGLALLTASQILLGFPQALMFSLLAEGAYTAMRFSRFRPGWLPRLTLVGSAICLGWMIGTVQWLPTILAAGESFRAAPAFEFQMHNSLHPFCLLAYVSPYLFHRHGGMDAPYAGILAPACLLWLVWRWKHLPRWWRFIIASAVLFAVFALLVAMGRHSAFAQAWVHLPMIGKFRFPSRYVFLFHLASVLLTAMALCDIQRVRPLITSQKPFIVFLPFLLSALIAVLALAAGQFYYHHCARLFPNFVFYTPGLAPTPHILAGPVLMLLAALCLWTAVRTRGPWGLVLCILLMTVDIGLYNMRHKPTANLDEFKSQIAMPPGVGEYRIDPDCLPVHAYTCPTLLGARVPQGFVALMPVNALDYYGQETALRLAGVKWRKARPCDLPPLTDAALRGEEWLELSDPMPRARLVGRVQNSSNPRHDVEMIDVRETALVEPGVNLDLSGKTNGTAQIIEDRPGKIRVRTRSDGVQLLIINERWASGWRAFVDGLEITPLRVYGDFMGIPVGSEAGEVRMEFSFAAQVLGGRISLAGCCLLLVFTMFGWKFERSRVRNLEFLQTGLKKEGI